MSGVEVRILDHAEMGAVRWDELADRVGASPFVRPGWVLPWLHAWGAGRRLVLLSAYRSGVPVGLLPLLVRGRVLASPTNWHTPAYAVAAEDDQVARALLTAAVGANRRRLQLGFVDDALSEEVAELATADGQPVLSRLLESGPYVDLKTTFAEYESTLSSRMRSELRRRRRRLEELGPVSVEFHEHADAGLLEEFLRVEAAGWKGAEGTAIAAEPPTRAFYLDVARWAADRGWLRLVLLRTGGRAIAGDFAVQADGVHYLLKTGFDPEYKGFGPGKLLRHAVIERAFADGLRSYEFLGRDDAWKLEWTTTVRRQLMVQAFARTPAGRVDHLAHRHARPVAKEALARARRWSRPR